MCKCATSALVYGAYMGNNLKHIREGRDLTLRQLAEKVKPKASFSMLQKLERSEKPLPEKWKKRLSEALECAPGDLDAPLNELEDRGTSEWGGPQLIPIRGYVAADNDSVVIFNYDEDEIEQVECPPFLNPKHLDAYQNKGPSQEPLIMDNWLLYVYRNKVFPGVPDEYLGELCMVKILADGEATGKTVVKFVTKGSSVGHYNLHSRNENIPVIRDAIIEHSAIIAGATPRKKII